MADTSRPHYLLAFLCIYYTLVLCLRLPCASASSFAFNFSSSETSPCGDKLQCRGDVSFSNNQAIDLTRNDRSRDSEDSRGWVWYARPVPLWDAATAELASFSTTFDFKITQDSTYGNNTGDGMAFFLAPYSTEVLHSATGGGSFGLFNDTYILNATGDNRVVAVEFDTHPNPKSI